MKQQLFIYAFLFCFIELSAQSNEDKIIYYDGAWKECNSEQASYYRVIEDYHLKKESYKVTDYFITGEKQMEGTYIDPDTDGKDGKFTWYYKNGNKEAEAHYKTNVKLGEYKAWYENGKEKLIGEYLKNNTDPKITGSLKVISFWDTLELQLVKDGYGEYYYCDDENKVCSRGKIEKGLKQGLWTGVDESVGLKYEEEYRKGEVIRGTSRDASGNEYIYKEITVSPSPKLGLQWFYSYIRGNLKYPDQARVNNIEGRVFVEFWVDEDGSLIDFKIYRGLGYGCDEEALRVLKNSPRWEPGNYRGKKTKMKMMLPMSFRLN